MKRVGTPVLEEAGGFGSDASGGGVGEFAPGVYLLADGVDELGRVVELGRCRAADGGGGLFGEAGGEGEAELLGGLEGVSAMFARFGDGGDEVGGAARFDDAVGGLARPVRSTRRI